MRNNVTRAFTLVETIVVIALTSIIMGSLGSLLVYFYKTNAYVYEQATATIQARRGVDDAVRYLREASYGTDGSYPIQTAATSTIALLADVNNDQTLERITYTLTNGVLSRTIAGSPAVTSIISSSVTNASTTPLFRYYDTAGTELTLPINKSKVASVKTTLVVRIQTNRGPAAFTLSGTAKLRNSGL
jgi:type II secretory pathway pseudopilin PulG